MRGGCPIGAINPAAKKTITNMELTLKRTARRQGYTIGKLSIDGQPFCDTLEDADRGLTADMPPGKIRELKVYGQTAIPTGRYAVTLDVVSPRFKDRSWARPYGGKIPRLLSVPGFEGVLCHPGNDSSATSGCILVGRNTVVGKVTDSVATFHALMKKLLAAGDDIFIDIE